MVYLQNSLNLRTSQRQVLTPGLVQMVSVLALNKLELKDMINAEMIENPMLEELDEAVAPLDEIAGEEGKQELSAEQVAVEAERVEKDPFDEIDFGSYFQDYLDPGYRTASNYEELDSPSFENFLSQPGTLTDHLLWQLGSLKLEQAVSAAAELIIGNLNEDGYLTAGVEELAETLAQTMAEMQPPPPTSVISFDFSNSRCSAAPSPLSNGHIDIAASGASFKAPSEHQPEPGADDRTSRGLIGTAAPEMQAAQSAVAQALTVVQQLDPVGVGARDLKECLLAQIQYQRQEAQRVLARRFQTEKSRERDQQRIEEESAHLTKGKGGAGAVAPLAAAKSFGNGTGHRGNGLAVDATRGLDRAGDSVRDAPHEGSQVPSHSGSLEARSLAPHASPRALDASPGAPEASGVRGPLGIGSNVGPTDVFRIAEIIVGKHLQLLQRKDMRELGRAAGCGAEMAQRVVEFIRTLDPRPGQRYNQGETRLIEPDVAFVKRGDEYLVVMNEEDMPSLRLSQSYRKLLRKESAEKEVREYVKERYKSAIQLMRNIEQRKNTILRTCESIVRRQREFLEFGVERLKPMMIKEVAEEVGVHPSTVSRAVANKYVHTSQGVYELRFFFSEGVNGPEGGGTPLMLLKRKVKKLIEEEDPRKPLTDDHLVAMLQQQGIEVTRRTVAKYREDLRIPSTHQRRVRT